MSLERRTPLRADPEKVRAWQNRSRKALPRVGRRGRAHRERMDDLRPAVHAAAGFRCEARIEGVCLGASTEAHHVWPSGRGGPDTMENLIAVCGSFERPGCHQWIHAHPAEARARGLLASA